MEIKTETRIINRSHIEDYMVYAYLWEILINYYTLPIEFEIDSIVINHRITPKGITVYEIDTL